MRAGPKDQPFRLNDHDRFKPQSVRALRRLADNYSSDSLANSLRRERFAFFRNLLNTVPRPLRILDVGGTENFWSQMGFLASAGEGIRIVLLNLSAPQVQSPVVSSVAGDGCSMPQYSDGEFDVVFSNSVIEHIPEPAGQKRMADEIRRVGRRYFIQTPNRRFPIEPHFLFPFFQFMPLGVKTALLQRYNLGWYPRTPDKSAARELAMSIRLLNEGELRALFPEAKLYRESFYGLTKSLIVYSGFGAAELSPSAPAPL